MRIISHRGNIDGVNPSRENSPTYIDCALGLGLDVEVDVRVVNGQFVLGHDVPQYEVSKKWLEMRSHGLWLHCKDLPSAQALKNVIGSRHFCHTSDPYVLTSTGHIWVHNLKLEIDDRCIIPLLLKEDVTSFNGKIPYAICTDYTSFASFELSMKGLR